ncbi:hypothetical protein [Chryseobacterium indoltheticum]|uniref:hypothetical protein n=1 Tax=Chryseobacterium indoltheticum TaxID=254 RepID=UPI0028E2A59D|nr:hypothetical protein [Chryseobacterium indoltheticum]
MLRQPFGTSGKLRTKVQHGFYITRKSPAGLRKRFGRTRKLPAECRHVFGNNYFIATQLSSV